MNGIRGRGVGECSGLLVYMYITCQNEGIGL